ncbi:MAG: CD1871A family CXXC motif-containing protein [Thermodesulfobacteriota bacterium]
MAPRRQPIRRLPLVLAAIFALAATVGLSAGEPAQVLAQAIRICLSCIGIG